MISILVCAIFSSSIAFSFNSTPATDLQPIFEEQAVGWLGADCSTSILTSSDEGIKSVLWLWGDTLVGIMIGGERNIKMMPRNSIATMYITPNGPTYLNFYWKYNESYPVHGGFFSPNDNSSNWYWVVSGVMPSSNDLFLFAYQTYQTGGGPFGFSEIGTAIIHVTNAMESPWTWNYSEFLLPFTNTTLNLASAATIFNEYVYLVGINAESQFIARINASDLLVENYQEIYFFTVGNNWEQFSESMQLMYLFEGQGMTETSIVYHPFLQSWFMLLIEPFGTQVLITMSEEITGPYSNPQVLYEIPAPWNSSSIFCYAPKSHMEFTTASNEIIFSFNSNTGFSIYQSIFF